MNDKPPADSDKRRRRRLRDADLTPEHRAAVEARRAERETIRYQEDLDRDIKAYGQEFPSAVDR